MSYLLALSLVVVISDSGLPLSWSMLSLEEVRLSWGGVTTEITVAVTGGAARL